jgi:hypothetical protein
LWCHLYFSIFDTKYLAAKTMPTLPATNLSDLHKAISQSPFDELPIEFTENMDRYKAEEYLHEAGYDAYLTGFCFARMAYKYLKGITRNAITTNVSRQSGRT